VELLECWKNTQIFLIDSGKRITNGLKEFKSEFHKLILLFNTETTIFNYCQISGQNIFLGSSYPEEYSFS